MPELHGPALIEELLEQIDEEAELGRALGIDLTGPVPDPGPSAYGSLEAWLRRSEEVHRFLDEQALRRHR